MELKRIVKGSLGLSLAAMIVLVGMRLSLSRVHADDESAAQVTMLSDSEGVNFNEYLRVVYLSVKKSWFENMPPSVSLGNQGINTVEFRILQNGSVPQDFVRMVSKSEKSDLDAASLRAVHGATFSHLPEKYSQAFIVLRFTFYYNFKNSGPGETKAARNSESRRIQNIAPEEMWNRVTECFFPLYPQLASATHITGTVNIGVGVTPEGDVGDNFRVLDGHPMLVQSATDAIRQWKFRPNEVQGEVTWSRVRALVRFDSDGTTAIDLAPAILADNFGDPGTPKPVATAFPRPSSAPVCQPVKAQAPKFVDGAYVPLIGGIGAPKCIECPDPSYSEQGRAAKVSGTVVLHLIVTEDGHATNIQVKRSLGHGLDEKAVEAVGNWRFEPAIGPEDMPVPVWTDVEVNFRIK